MSCLRTPNKTQKQGWASEGGGRKRGKKRRVRKRGRSRGRGRSKSTLFLRSTFISTPTPTPIFKVFLVKKGGGMILYHPPLSKGN
jgi:hypothetical protein